MDTNSRGQGFGKRRRLGGGGKERNNGGVESGGGKCGGSLTDKGGGEGMDGRGGERERAGRG